MKTHLSFIALVTILSSLCLAAPEKGTKEKGAGANDYPFWSSKKRADAPEFVPGLNAILQITPTQQEQIAAARNEMANDEAFKAARSISKNDPSVTQEQRDKARAAVDAANAKLREKVAAILTPEQAALIAKVNAAYQGALDEVGTVYEEKFASIKADPAARQRVQQEKNQDTEDHFLHKLDTLLTPAQKDAMTKAAEEEQRRTAASPKKPAK
ncbi:MAG TPA: hypothetical protein VK961_12230 [Chthoniobacter sp.]|nr:hypothetical protein [Chthoniobacter sp.]